MEHAGQEQAIRTFLAIHQMRLKRDPLFRREPIFDIALCHRKLVDITVVHSGTSAYLTHPSTALRVLSSTVRAQVRRPWRYGKLFKRNRSLFQMAKVCEV